MIAVWLVGCSKTNEDPTPTSVEHTADTASLEETADTADTDPFDTAGLAEVPRESLESAWARWEGQQFSEFGDSIAYMRFPGEADAFVVIGASNSFEQDESLPGRVYGFTAAEGIHSTTNAAWSLLDGPRSGLGKLIGVTQHVDGAALLVSSNETVHHVYRITTRPDALEAPADAWASPLFDIDDFSFGAGLGASVDTDGDGIGEVLIGSEQSPIGEGRLHYWQTTGLSASTVADTPTRTWCGVDGESIGFTAVATHDVTGDGLIDIVTPATRNGYTENPSRLYILDPSAPDGNARDVATATIRTPPDHLMGLVQIDDLNNDGVGDILAMDSGPDGERRTLVFFGPIDGMVSTNQADVAFDFGQRVVTTDFDGDGFRDLVIGSFWQDPFLAIVRGPIEPGNHGLARASLILEDPDDATFQHALYGGFDADGDGLEDLLYGNPSSLGSGHDWEGRVYLVRGRVLE